VIIICGGMLSVEDFTEELLESHDAELKKLQQYYDTNRHVFEKIAEREEMWKKFLAFEVWMDL